MLEASGMYRMVGNQAWGEDEHIILSMTVKLIVLEMVS